MFDRMPCDERRVRTAHAEELERHRDEVAGWRRDFAVAERKAIERNEKLDAQRVAVERVSKEAVAEAKELEIEARAAGWGDHPN